MPRIRTIKPEFWSDEKVAPLDPLTRLVYLALISLADDGGRLIDNLKTLDGQIFPSTEDSCAVALETLASISRIIRYVSRSGQCLIQIAKWEDHQRVDHPNKHVLPAPPKTTAGQPPTTSGVAPKPPSHSRDPREDRASISREPRATTLVPVPVPTTGSTARARDNQPTGLGRFMSAIPEAKHAAWEARLANWASGVDVPPGQRPDINILSTALGEYVDEGGSYQPRHVWAFVASVVRRFAAANATVQRPDERVKPLDPRRVREQEVFGRRGKDDGEDWWDRMIGEAQVRSVDVVDYAHAHRDEPADVPYAAPPLKVAS